MRCRPSHRAGISVPGVPYPVFFVRGDNRQHALFAVTKRKDFEILLPEVSKSACRLKPFPNTSITISSATTVYPALFCL